MSFCIQCSCWDKTQWHCVIEIQVSMKHPSPTHQMISSDLKTRTRVDITQLPLLATVSYVSMCVMCMDGNWNSNILSFVWMPIRSEEDKWKPITGTSPLFVGLAKATLHFDSSYILTLHSYTLLELTPRAFVTVRIISVHCACNLFSWLTEKWTFNFPFWG